MQSHITRGSRTTGAPDCESKPRPNIKRTTKHGMPRLSRLILHWLGLADHPEPWSGPSGDFFISAGYSAIWERQQRATIYRDESDLGYWIASDAPLRGYREFFRCISADEFQALTAHIPRNSDGFHVVTPPDEAILQVARSVPRSL
jgi:hypothetical protein